MKRKITITIELENDAFQPDPAPEVANILGRLTQSIGCDGFIMAGNETDYGAACGLWDVNGNWCGHWYAVLDDSNSDPRRWDALTMAELDTIRTALNLRLCQLHAGGRECDCQEEKESLLLGELDRSMQREIERRRE